MREKEFREIGKEKIEKENDEERKMRRRRDKWKKRQKKIGF